MDSHSGIEIQHDRPGCGLFFRFAHRGDNASGGDRAGLGEVRFFGEANPEPGPVGLALFAE